VLPRNDAVGTLSRHTDTSRPGLPFATRTIALGKDTVLRLAGQGSHLRLVASS
jgi:hypothetical protein